MKVVRAGWSSLSVSHLTSAVLVGEVPAKVSGCCCFRRVWWENFFFTECFFNGIPKLLFQRSYRWWGKTEALTAMPWDTEKVVSLLTCIWAESLKQLEWNLVIYHYYYYYYYYLAAVFQELQWRTFSLPFHTGKPSLEEPVRDVLTAQLRKLSATK